MNLSRTAFFIKRAGDKKIINATILVCVILAAIYFTYALSPVKTTPAEKVLFEVKTGEGFREIVGNLREDRLIRSTLVFQLFSFLSGSVSKLKPGIYELRADMSSPAILKELKDGVNREEKVVIKEGTTIYELDELLSQKNVLLRGELISFYSSTAALEGKLFPDTYNFFIHSEPEIVAKKLLANFETKAGSILSGDPQNKEINLTLASLLEREASDSRERQLIAGILKKRIAAGIPLQVDASICYVKQAAGEDNCLPITVLDLKIDSPYNTYIHKGWPPGPINSPGISAIKAALEPINSPYWYYLSDPKTNKIIFSKSLDEHTQNRVQYLIQ